MIAFVPTRCALLLHAPGRVPQPQSDLCSRIRRMEKYRQREAAHEERAMSPRHDMPQSAEASHVNDISHRMHHTARAEK